MCAKIGLHSLIERSRLPLLLSSKQPHTLQPPSSVVSNLIHFLDVDRHIAHHASTSDPKLGTLFWNDVMRSSQEVVEMRGCCGNNGGGDGSGSSESGQGKKLGWSPASGGGDAGVWPKFVIGLTNKEKEEDFLAFKGSKPSQRPKKRSKTIQNSLNLVSPGSWLCELTLERYEVREKRIPKKRRKGLKAMGNIEGESQLD